MKYLLIGLLLATAVARAQPPKIEWTPKSPNPAGMPLDDAGEIRFQRIGESPKLSKGLIIQRVSIWAARFAGGTETVVTTDTAQGVIVINGRLTIKQSSPLVHKLVIEAKPGRYRATADELAYQFELTTPARVTKTYKLHPYGISAEDYHDFYTIMGVGQMLVNPRKIAIKAADNQDAILVDIKQSIEAMLDSLQKSVGEDKDW